jgi:PAS domain S-box-containing protein
MENARTFALKISGIYVVTAAAWILLSDIVLSWFITDVRTFAEAQTLKGWFFVTVTGIALYASSKKWSAALSKEVDERRQTYEDLRASEEKYRVLFDNSLDAILLTTTDGKVLSANQAACAMFGWTEAEICSAGRPGLIDTSDPRLAPLLEERQRKGKAIGELTLLRKDGTRFPAELSSLVFRDKSGEEKTSMIIRDVSERKRVEGAMQHLNRELRAMTNCNQTVMRATDEQTLVKDICRIVCEEAGYLMAWVGYAEHNERKSVRPVSWAGAEDGYLARADISWADTERGRGPTGTAIRSGKSVYIQDYANDPRVALWRDIALQRGYRCSIALPLRDETGGTFGTLTLYASEPTAFTADEIRLLEELANDLAFGISVLRARSKRILAEESLSEQ